MIPTELMDYIFSLLHTDQDYTTLKTSSLVFPQLVDRHLYSRITLRSHAIPPSENVQSTISIDKGTYDVDPNEFSSTLAARPHIASYVRDLRIHIEDRSESMTSDDLLRVISSFLSDLSRLESIALLSFHYIPWNTLFSGFCAAFQSRFRLPSIKQVAILYIDGFPLNAFDDCRNLTNLRLCGRFAYGKGRSRSTYPRLRSLYVSGRADCPLRRVTAWSNTLHTLSLSLHVVGLNLPKLRPLFEACSSTLVILKLENVCCDFSKLPIFPEMQFPLLEHIFFTSPLVQIGDVNNAFLPSPPSLGSIKTISSPSPIRLTIHFDIFSSPRRVQSDLQLEWSNFASTLVLPIFRHPIELHVTQIMDPKAQPTDVISFFEQNLVMKRMLNNGKVVIMND